MKFSGSSVDYHVNRQIFPEIQIEKKFSEAAACIVHSPPLSSSLHLSLSPTHFLFPLPHPLRHKPDLNGCGDDAVCLRALWVMSGSPCIAVNMESEHCRVNQGRIWRLHSVSSSIALGFSWTHQMTEGCFAFLEAVSLFFYDHEHGGVCRVTRMLGMCSRHVLEDGVGLCCPLQAKECYCTRPGAHSGDGATSLHQWKLIMWPLPLISGLKLISD